MQESATGASFIYISYVKKKKKMYWFLSQDKKAVQYQVIELCF